MRRWYVAFDDLALPGRYWTRRGAARALRRGVARLRSRGYGDFVEDYEVARHDTGHVS